jgi:outer membrane murein-binding lipoprotein Lpp
MVTGTAILTLSGQAVILAAAVLGYLSTRKKVDGVSGRVGEVHQLAAKTEKLVNNQLDRQMIYNQQMAAALVANHIPVPEQEPGPVTEGT